MNNREIEKYILEQFVKKVNIDIDKIRIELDTDDWGNYENEAVIIERKDNGKVWNVVTYSTGRIRCITEIE